MAKPASFNFSNQQLSTTSKNQPRNMHITGYEQVLMTN